MNLASERDAYAIQIDKVENLKCQKDLWDSNVLRLIVWYNRLRKNGWKQDCKKVRDKKRERKKINHDGNLQMTCYDNVLVNSRHSTFC